jgi:hypothetical protein
MSKLVEINLRPDRSTLRKFGFIALVGFALVALLAYMEWAIFAMGLGAARIPVTAVFAALAGVTALFSLVLPRANLPIYVGLTLIALPIGLVLSYVIMATIFYLVITPIGLAVRALGRDPLERRFLPEAATYWQDARPTPPRERYFRQF